VVIDTASANPVSDGVLPDRHRSVLAAFVIAIGILAGARADVAAQLCPTAPMADCVYSTNFSRLRLQTGVFLWKWRRGSLFAADVGNPVESTDFSVCLYADDLLFQEMAVPHGGQCGKRACWKQLTDRGFAFQDPEGRNSGINWVKFKFSPLKAIMKIKGRGPSVAFPLPLTVDTAVTMQMVNSLGKCWQGIFPVPPVKSTDQAYIDTTSFLTDGR